MTREEAITFLYSIAGNLGFIDCENYTCKDGEKMRDAIKVLEQESCTDAISRQYLIDKAVSWDKHFADGIRYVALTDILNAPPVTLPNLFRICEKENMKR